MIGLRAIWYTQTVLTERAAVHGEFVRFCRQEFTSKAKPLTCRATDFPAGSRTACSRCQAGVPLSREVCRNRITSASVIDSFPCTMSTVDAYLRSPGGNHFLSFLPTFASFNSKQNYFTLMGSLPGETVSSSRISAPEQMPSSSSYGRSTVLLESRQPGIIPR